jgi:hypothetical protein
VMNWTMNKTLVAVMAGAVALAPVMALVVK